MSLWSRIGNVFRGERLNREIEEEFHTHLEEAIAQGRDPDEARRAFGSLLHIREDSRDVKLLTWLDSLRADVVFGWRQLRKHRTASAVSILSLALATSGPGARSAGPVHAERLAKLLRNHGHLAHRRTRLTPGR